MGSNAIMTKKTLVIKNPSKLNKTLLIRDKPKNKPKIKLNFWYRLKKFLKKKSKPTKRKHKA